jgi:hypothetical protein
MAYAPDLHGAFLWGQGVHGAYTIRDGKKCYNDDLYFYDFAAHRWICIYPGTNVEELTRKLDGNGWEVTEDGQHVPIDTNVHGYESSDYDRDRRRFVFIGGISPYGDAIRKKRDEWLPGTQLNLKLNKIASEYLRNPTSYDVATNRWERVKCSGGEKLPLSGCAAYWYLPISKKLLYYPRGDSLYVLDPQKEEWSSRKPSGPPPEPEYEGISCLDSKRELLYLFNRRNNTFPWIYDFQKNIWIDPKPEGPQPKGRGPDGKTLLIYTAKAMATYDDVHDIVVFQSYLDSPDPATTYQYDVKKNLWLPPTVPPQKRILCMQGFYDSEWDVHVYFLAGDSSPNPGDIWVFRSGYE